VDNLINEALQDIEVSFDQIPRSPEGDIPEEFQDKNFAAFGETYCAQHEDIFIHEDTNP